MSGVFRSSRPAPAAAAPAAAPAAPAAAPAAAPVIPEPTSSTGLGAAPLQQQPTARIVNRASTMLSSRRAGDDVRVGTKKLLGQ